MQARLKHILSVVVLVVYLSSGAMAFWGVLGQVFRSSSPVQLLAGSKRPTSQPMKVVWTQQKHYPSSAQNDVPMPAIVSGWTFNHWRVSFILGGTQQFAEYTSAGSTQYSPRSPPHS